MVLTVLLTSSSVNSLCFDASFSAEMQFCILTLAIVVATYSIKGTFLPFSSIRFGR